MRKLKYVFVIALVSMTGCTGKKETSGSNGVIPVKVQEARLSLEANECNYVGTVEEISGSSLSFQMAGNVQKVFVSEGESVSKGQLLAVLDKATVKNMYEAALSTLKRAQDGYERLSALYEKGSLPEIKFVEIQTSLQQAQSAERIAHKNLDDCNLYAPFNGVIADRSVEPGMNVVPGVSVFKLVTIDKVKVKASIPENEISQMKEGQTARVNVAALNHKVFEGIIKEKGVMANPLSHTYEIKVELNNPDKELMPGMVCEVLISSDTTAKGIIIPNNAIQILNAGEHFVWLFKDGVARQKLVTTGAITNQGVVVTSGLAQGDKVIVEGNQKVSEGMKIEVR
ncbi:MAG: efflux RND transporter periplasmic adaptor subunit [Bacteroidales bacterium]|nr:efflux RND transporter periplasmic adaptor subunit [Bacteroidales bacterium]